MELALNLLWVLISTAAVCGWMAHCLCHSRKRDLLREALVLGCILWLLFPVISVTDDLWMNSDAVEEWNSLSRRIKVIPTAAVTLGTFIALLVAFVGLFASILVRKSWAITVEMRPTSVVQRRSHDRSPPAVSLALPN